MEIKQMSVKDIVPYEKNAKKHPAEQVEHIANSIKEFGWQQPIVIDKNNVVVIGHGRLLAAKKLKMKEVPIVCAEDLTDEQIMALRLADNKTNESEWDLDFLGAELDDILDIDMTKFGFDLTEEEEEPAEVIEDDVPEEIETRCKLGDIWQLGNHRLICGDSTDVTVIDSLMDGVKADMVFTDPPYGMKKESEGVLNDNLNFDDLLDFNRQWIPITFGALKDNGSWYCWGIDEPLMDIYSNILKPMARKNKITFRNLITWDKGNGQGQLSFEFRMYPIADEKCLFVMCGTQGFSEESENMEWCIPIVNKIKAKADAHGYKAQDLKRIIGHSENSPDHFLSYSLFRFPQKEYFIKWFGDEGKEYESLKEEYESRKEEYELRKNEFYKNRAYFDNTHDNMNNVWHFDRAGKSEREHAGGHATPKPIALCGRAIKSSSREGEVVLDVFGGSGSTLIACEQLNRKCYMAELDPHYCDVIIQRWENLTGKQAELLEAEEAR